MKQLNILIVSIGLLFVTNLALAASSQSAPTRNNTPNPPTVNIYASYILRGETRIDLNNYFNNPDYSGSLHYSDQDVSSISVTNPAGDIDTLKMSILSMQNLVQLNGSTLVNQNSAPQLIPTAGIYTVQVFAANAVGRAEKPVTIQYNIEYNC